VLGRGALQGIWALRRLLLAGAGAGAAAAVACAGPPASDPPILRPIDEPQAIAIMAHVFRQLQVEPVRNRVIRFGPHDAELVLDVAARDRAFGIAYITHEDAEDLAGDLPPHPASDAILVVRGNGEDGDVHAALLFAADYMQDDLAGERHTSTAIAATMKLELATRDVLRRAEQEEWP
jgi:hypothetical protein